MPDKLQNETCEVAEQAKEALDGDEAPGLTEATEEALRMAKEKGLPPLDACLRFCHEERRRAREEEERAAKAAAQSAGSLFAAAVRPQPEQEAFTRAFRDALGR